MILINGCSFTALNDQWPKFFSIDHKNIAVPGSSNDRIFIETVEELRENHYNTVIVMWTFLERTFMPKANHEIKNILVNAPIGKGRGDNYLNPEEVNGSDIENNLENFKKQYYSYFYSEQIQKRKLEVYKYCLTNSCNQAIHLNVNDVIGTKDDTGHPTPEASQVFAKNLMDTYFNE